MEGERQSARQPAMNRQIGTAMPSAFKDQHDASSRIANVALNMLFFVTLSWIVLFSSDRGLLAAAGNAGVQLFYISAFVLSIVALARSDIPYRTAMPTIGIGITLGWCWLSTFWAIDGSIAISRISLTTLIIVTLFIATRVSGYKNSIRIFRNYMIFAIVFSYIWVFTIPESGIQLPKGPLDADAGASWRGIFLEKNMAGAVSAIAAFYFIFCDRNKNNIIRLIIIVLYIIFLWQTKSKTSIIFFCCIFLLGLVSIMSVSIFKSIALLLAPFLLCGIIIYWNEIVSPLANALYSPSAFTGRGPIWSTLIRYISEHWFLGSGYGSFWSIGPNSPVFSYAQHKWVMEVAIGHNGYLDMLSQVGIIGLFLMIFSVFIFPIFKIFASNSYTAAQFTFFFAVLLFSIGNNFMESSLFDRNNPLNVITFFVVSLISASAYENRLSFNDRFSIRRTQLSYSGNTSHP